jgi:hypothetical protein
MDTVKQWLEWAIDFIQKDLSKLNRTEKYSFYQKLNWFSGPYLLNTSFDPFGKAIQFSENQITEWERIVPEIREALKQFIDQMTITRANYRLPELTSWIRPEGLWPPSPKDHHIYFQAHSIPKDLTPKNWAILNLSRLIQGLEMHVISRCAGCHRYFFNFSLRKKNYCSPRCTSNNLARTRRERWGEQKYNAYKAKQRKRVALYREKKKKAEGKIVRPRPKIRGLKRIPKIL